MCDESKKVAYPSRMYSLACAILQVVNEYDYLVVEPTHVKKHVKLDHFPR